MLIKFTFMIMKKSCFVLCLIGMNAFGESPWGSKYFPNIELTTHEGKSVTFFDDLIDGKIVVINFIYTSCPDVCPLETAQLTRVKKILGNRVGKDLFFYSITIDPDHDTPQVLASYRKKFNANWMFLTGNEKDIIQLRKKLGLFIEENRADLTKHNVSMIIGNQKTGRWMRRSPFENPYVLADQIGNWLDGWRSPQQVKDYAKAPGLRDIGDGEYIFRTRCASCHTINGTDEKNIGPDLLGVHFRRDVAWLQRWLKEPDKMLEEGDKTAVELLEEYNGIPMPNLDLTDIDIDNLLVFFDEAYQWYVEPDAQDVVSIKNAWVRKPMHDMPMTAAYFTLKNATASTITITGVTSEDIPNVSLHEMRFGKMKELDELVLSPKEEVVLEPGGMHLMLTGLDGSMQSGETIRVTIHFRDGRQKIVKMRVRSS